MSKSEFPLADQLHEIIRAMICREIDTIFDSIDEIEERVLSIDKGLARRLKDLEEFTGLYNDNEIEDARTSEQIKSDVEKSITGRFENVSARIYNSEKRIGKLTDKVLQLEEFTGLTYRRKIWTDEIKSDIKKKEAK